jgi:hypothetical protein
MARHHRQPLWKIYYVGFIGGLILFTILMFIAAEGSTA